MTRPAGLAAILRAATAAGLTAVAAVEVASFAGLVSPAAGAAIGVLAIGVFIWFCKPSLRGLTTGKFGLVEIAVALFAGTTLIVAMLAPPNTWDSLTYHLPRIDHWFEQGSVAHYATTIDRQIWQPPFAEYLVLVARSFSGGGDRLANGVQWLAAIGCAVAVARIAEVLGLGMKNRWLTALLAITSPPVVLQASSTQNDLVVAFWLLAGAGFVLETLSGADDPADWFWIGATFALGIGTKGTALVFGLPWLVIFTIAKLRRLGRAGLAPIGGAIAIITLLNAPWAYRNFDTYGNPLGDPVVQRLLRPGSVAPPAVLGNLVANASLHWAIPGEGFRLGSERVVTTIYTALGVDSRKLYPYFGGFRVVPWSTDEDQAGNPLLFVAGLATVVAVAVRWNGRGPHERTLTVAILGSGLLFGLVVRWQPYNSRLELPGFLLLAPLIIAGLNRWSGRAAQVFGLGAVLVGLPPLLANATRPVLPGRFRLGNTEVDVGSVLSTDRTTQYFAREPGMARGYRLTAERLAATKCTRVAVKAGYDSWEYPLWALTRHAGVPTGFEPNWVDNATRKHQPPASMPCGVVALDQSADWVPAPFTGWTAVVREPRIVLWMPEPATPQTR